VGTQPLQGRILSHQFWAEKVMVLVGTMPAKLSKKQQESGLAKHWEQVAVLGGSHPHSVILHIAPMCDLSLVVVPGHPCQSYLVAL